MGSLERAPEVGSSAREQETDCQASEPAGPHFAHCQTDRWRAQQGNHHQTGLPAEAQRAAVAQKAAEPVHCPE